jgi:hypothetical protein
MEMLRSRHRFLYHMGPLRRRRLCCFYPLSLCL